MKPTVSLCMIVRDEEANISKCLEGVRGLFDEMIIVDTGSTDATKSIAEEFGAKVFDFPWTDDFAAARNESRRHASGRWIFWLDADDRVDEIARGRLRNLFAHLDKYDEERIPVFMISVLSKCADEETPFIMSQARMFRNEPQVRWEGRIHERLNCTESCDQIAIHPTEVTICHEGYADAGLRARKQFRELRLLELDYLINPDDPMTLFYLARIHLWQNHPTEAIRFARRSISAEKGPSIVAPMAFTIVAESFLKLGRLMDALAACEEGLTHFPADTSLAYRRGCTLHDLGRLAEAESCLRQLLQIPPENFSLVGRRIGIHGADARLVLARICARQKRWSEADIEIRHVLAVKPTSFSLWLFLGSVNLCMGRKQEVLSLILGLQAYPNTKMEQMVLRSQLSMADQNLEEAKGFAREAIAIRPGAIEPWAVLADILFAEGKHPEMCIDAHRKVLAMDPSQTAVRQRLEKLLATAWQAVPFWGNNSVRGEVAANAPISIAG